MKPEQKKETGTSHKIVVAACAFIRAQKQPDGTTIYTCLLKRGQPCPQSALGPKTIACPDAVRKSKSRKLQERFWASVEKHKKKTPSAKDSAFSMMHSRRDEYLFCKRKERYPTEKNAKEMKKRCEELRGIPLRVLYCPFCRGWHLTHKYGAQQRARDAAFEKGTADT